MLDNILNFIFYGLFTVFIFWVLSPEMTTKISLAIAKVILEVLRAIDGY